MSTPNHNSHQAGIPKAPEIELAESLIARLTQNQLLADSVIQVPCSLEEQTHAVQITTGATGLCIAVIPLWPAVVFTGVKSNEYVAHNGPRTTNIAEITHARLQVAVIATKNIGGLNGVQTIHSAVGFTIATILRWDHESTRGIPYADPRIDDISDLDLKKLSYLQNAVGASILVSKPVSFKHYYKNI